MTDSPEIADLTFVSRTERGTLDLWTPERPDNYEEANAMGRDYAAELLLFMRRTGEHVIFGGVMRAITRGGMYGPVEVGFCHYLGIELAGLPIPRVTPNLPPRVAPDDAAA